MPLAPPEVRPCPVRDNADCPDSDYVSKAAGANRAVELRRTGLLAIVKRLLQHYLLALLIPSSMLDGLRRLNEEIQGRKNEMYGNVCTLILGILISRVFVRL